MRTWDLHALREKLGIVTQDTRLFSGTIRDNVTLFDASIPPEEVEAACRKACLDDAIQQMPMGYDTLLADGGSSLSGGQRQRLSLARALVRKPSVLILDEATSALDVITERAVQDNLRELRCTRVIVAHRLSTVVEADKIMVLEEGKLVGVGRHQDLVARCATYRELVHSQSEAARSSPLLSAEREVGSRRPVRGVTATLVSLANAKAPGTGPFAVAAASAIASPATLTVPATHQLAVSADRPASGGTDPAVVLSAQAPAPPSAAPEPAPAAVGARTIAGVTAPTRQNSVAAADDGTRVKWGKPPGG
jgi:ABC-type methionine transport system ATPase subunit